MTELKRRFKKIKSLEDKNLGEAMNETGNETAFAGKTTMRVDESRNSQNRDKKQIDADPVVKQKVDTKYLADIEDVDDRKRAFD
jgi:hypothetical protein